VRIAIIMGPFTRIPPEAIGAVEIRWYNVARVLAKRGHTVHVTGWGSPECDRRMTNFEVSLVKGYRSGGLLRNILLSLPYLLKAIRKTPKSDIVVANNFWGPIVLPLFFRWKFHKIVYNVACMPKRQFPFYVKCDAFCCVSSVVCEATRRLLPRSFRGVCRTVNNPVATEYFHPGLTQPHESGRPYIVGFHGRIHKGKGLVLLARAVRMLTEQAIDVRLRIIGSWDVSKGGSGEEYKREVDDSAKGLVDWVPPISNRAQLAQSLAQCDVYCYPTIYKQGEAFGVAPLEAMALGLPVVLSNMPCFEDYVKDGVNAVYFDYQSNDPVRSLYEKLLQVITDEQFRKGVSSEAVKVADCFSVAGIATQYEEFFRGLL